MTVTPTDAAGAAAARRVLLVFGHPRADSLCGAFADAYMVAARRAGAAVRRLDLSALSFVRDVTHRDINDQTMEDDLRAAEEAMLWAEHLVFVYPTWWGTCPALMKAFLDRILRPGFAFRETGGLTGFEGLLRGRSAHLITTMDTPRFVYRFLYFSPGHNALARATLGFCGIGPVRVTSFGPVHTSDAAIREAWIAQVAAEGAAQRPVLQGALWRGIAAAAAWLRALRLQFYPMSWAAFALGAVAAAGGETLGTLRFWTMYAALFLVEAATVFVNEIEDYESDRRNAAFGPFTGGSRVLVDGVLTRASLGRAAAGCVAAAVLLAIVAALPGPAPALPPLIAFAALSVLALCYTLRPVRLAWRTLGEVDVAWTHSIGVLLVGYLLFGGAPDSVVPWLLGLPLALAVLPSILLAGLPDRDADAEVGKRTIAVRFGARATLVLSAAAVIASTVTAASLSVWWGPGSVFGAVLVPLLIHGALCIWLMGRLHAAPPGPACRIDGILVCSLGYMVWFAAGPLIALI